MDETPKDHDGAGAKPGRRHVHRRGNRPAAPFRPAPTLGDPLGMAGPSRTAHTLGDRPRMASLGRMAPPCRTAPRSRMAPRRRMASPRRTSPPRSKAGPSRPAPTLGDRRGMTLVELIVVTVLGSVILASVYQILVTNQRAFAAQSAGVRNQQSLRAAVDVLFGELREVSPADGDLVAMGDHALHVRSPRSLGLVCGIVTGGVDPTVQAKVFGRYLRGDSARVFVENNPELRADDVWTTARVAVADTTGLLTCPDGEEAQEIRLEGMIHGAPPDSITDGALIRNFRHFRYGLRTYADAPYLVRIDESGTMAPLVGPLRAEDGVEFRYLDGDGNVAATAAAVRQVEVALRTRAMQVDADGAPLQDSLKLRIYTRNTS